MAFPLSGLLFATSIIVIFNVIGCATVEPLTLMANDVKELFLSSEDKSKKIIEVKSEIALTDVSQPPAQANYSIIANQKGYRYHADELHRRAAAHYLVWQNSGEIEALQNALLDMETAIHIAPDNSEYWYFQGLLLAEIRTDAMYLALVTYSLIEALNLDANHARARLLLAQTLQASAKFHLAIEQYKILLADHPSMATGIVVAPLALAYVAAENLSDGVEYFQKLASSHPHSAAIRTSLAVLLRHNNETAKAKTELEQITKQHIGSVSEQRYAQTLMAQWQAEVQP